MKYRCGECGCLLETGETWPGDKCQWNERHGDAMQARIAELEALLKEADDYLNINTLTSIGSGSIIHSAFKQALEKTA
jgi:hypothetical protein